jgi:hypothetical protein
MWAAKCIAMSLDEKALKKREREGPKNLNVHDF